MGIIDSATITLVCPRCDLKESHRIFDHGNRWGGSDWQVPTYSKFEATITGGHKLEPEVIGTCPQCKVVAEVSTHYKT